MSFTDVMYTLAYLSPQLAYGYSTSQVYQRLIDLAQDKYRKLLISILIIGHKLDIVMAAPRTSLNCR